MKLIKSTLQEKECLQTKSHKKPLTDTINLEFPSDKNGAAIDKVLQEEHDLIMVGDENQKMVLLTWKNVSKQR